MKTIGIIGGMGPDATNHLCSLITKLTPAKSDQQHIPVIVFNNATIPSRVDAIFLGAVNHLYLSWFARLEFLQSAGADFLVMPCNTAHYYLADLQAAVHIPILNMVEQSILRMAIEFSSVKTVGILGSTATLSSGLFFKSLEKLGKNVLTPDPDVQEELVMNAIFGVDGIKSGSIDQPKKQLLQASQHLQDKGAELIIAGCTEVSLVLSQVDLDVPLIDPLTVIADMAVKLAMSTHAGFAVSSDLLSAGTVRN